MDKTWRTLNRLIVYTSIALFETSAYYYVHISLAMLKFSRASDEYEDVVDEFIAFTLTPLMDKTSIRCPCISCKNFNHLSPDIVKDHLIIEGIDMTYDPFVLHGEEGQVHVVDEGVETTDFNLTETYEMLKATNENSVCDVEGNELPHLVYVSHEKRPGFDHHKKAGAMHALVRVSTIISNAPYFLNVDCDHYINNSKALREAMCFMMYPISGKKICYVQFPQRFDGIDRNDRYSNCNIVFFDVRNAACFIHILVFLFFS
ncbi:hypothetical protein IFM89_000491 [Coptis chinensis]|uniref:Transposase-associated domain-containing protein n=1 Tax=Coptis chinensis TaxID=261450 RepID=A0A835H1M6_9MAGN|nr:hypothetical protein IFM89_000491 [Coptis chinensis]